MSIRDDDGNDRDEADLDLLFGDENYVNEIINGPDTGGQRLRLLSDQNPWHNSGAVPATLAPSTERPLARVLWTKMLDDGLLRWNVILGPRRVGKTTVLYQTVARLLAAGIERHRIWWLRLDHPLFMDVPLGEIVQSMIAFARSSSAQEVSPERPIFVFLDEVTYADDWDLWLKTFHDERWPIRIAATSSASAALRRRRQDSGVGRWREISLAPCLVTEAMQFVAPLTEQSRHEIPPETSLADELRRLDEGTTSDFASSEAARMLMLVGGFPELLLHAAQVRLPKGQGLAADNPPFIDALVAAQLSLREDSVERAVYKDIPQAFQIDNPMMLERLLYVLAGQVAQLLSPSNIAADLRLAEATIERYLAYLEAAFIVFTLPNYAGSEAKVQRRGRKIYFVDSAVRSAVLQRGLAPLQHPGEAGHLIENMAAATLHALATQAGARLYHWREGRDEADLVYDDLRAPLAFEITSSALHDLSGLRALIRRHGRFAGNAYLVGRDLPVTHPTESSEGIGTLPWDIYLTTVSRLAESAMMTRLGETG
ncbi:ATP-binding protein [Candidatus Poriferisodalis sp.]|uniref:ATP-binding protein n=1 Tax=Candidatus Poriferisodalis sp. TaxID=3101277 RepID=UPI003AF77F17